MLVVWDLGLGGGADGVTSDCRVTDLSRKGAVAIIAC